MPDGSEPLDVPPADDPAVPGPAGRHRFMDLREFMELGILQEVNRQILHPVGLAIVLNVDDDRVSFAGIADDRWDPEGIRLDLTSYPDPAWAVSRFRSNIASFERLWEGRRPAREAALGYMVQPTTDPLLGG